MDLADKNKSDIEILGFHFAGIIKLIFTFISWLYRTRLEYGAKINRCYIPFQSNPWTLEP